MIRSILDHKNPFIVLTLWAILCSGAAVAQTPTDSVPCLIITTSQLEGTFESLRETKIRRGTNTHILTIEEIDQLYSGEDTQEKIRSCIKHYYQNKHLEWVILGGDEVLVPARFVLYEHVMNPSIPMVSDYYFSCLDGTWNADGDTLYAETESSPDVKIDSVDLIPEVAVGRLPYSTSSEVQSFLHKLNAYESGEPYGWQTNLLSLRSDIGANNAGIEEDLLELVPEHFNVTRQNDDEGGTASLAAYFDAVNYGQAIICKNGHSQWEGNYFLHKRDWWDILHNENVDTLSNHNMPSVVYAMSCNLQRLDGDCMGEHYMRHPTGGAVAFIGSSCLDNGFISEWILAGFFGSLFDGTCSEVGRLLNIGRVDLVEDIRYRFWGGKRNVVLGYLLTGDPQMRIWTDLPKFIRQPEVAPVLSGELTRLVDTVTDTNTGEPLAGATVCLYKPGEVYEVKMTDEDGIVSFSVVFSSSGIAHLTAGKTGYVWRETEIEVLRGPNEGLPTTFRLFTNHPNPFNASTTIEYELLTASHVHLDVYNILGQHVVPLFNGYQEIGHHTIPWNGTDGSGSPVAGGVYIYRLSVGDESATKKMLLLK